MIDTYCWADHRIVDSATGHGDAVLFGADDASIFALDAATRAVLARWAASPVIDLAQALPAERDILEALRDARILVPSARPARNEGPCLQPADIPLGTLVLEVAQACNLRCTYCYAAGGAYGRDSRLMTPQVARRAARYLIESSGDRPRVNLVLFGGEPLLNFAAIEAAVLEAEAAAQVKQKALTVSLTTNGTRLTPEAIDFLVAHRVGITVSIDGPPDLHDANRRHAGVKGAGTYADVLEGLARLRARGAARPAARVTLTPEQWSRIPEVFDHVAGLGFVEVGIAPASPITGALLPTPDQEQVLIQGFSRLAERFVAAATDGRVLPFSNLLDVLARLHTGQVKAAPCGAGLGYLALDAEGEFFLCHRLAGDDAFGAGNLDAGVDHARIGAMLAAQAAPRKDACAKCWARSLCAGGCHHDNHVREVELGLAPGGSCDFIRRWLELGIRVYAELAQQPDNNPVLAFLSRRAEA